MKKSIFEKHWLSACAAIMLCGFSASAFSASTWWSQNLVSTCATPSGGLASVNCGANPVTTVSGWSTAPYTSSGAAFASAKVFEYSSGLGVVASSESSSTTGPHAADNKYGTDAFLLSFSNSVTLTSLTIGWDGTDDPTGSTSGSYRDSDISVLAWTGTGTPTSPGDFKPNAMNGWTLISNFSNVGANTPSSGNDTQSWATSLTSSYWLISAYNSAYGGNAIGDARIDAFKLYSIAGNTQPPGGQTPEPGSIALFGIGLIGMVAARRRKTAL